MVHRGYFGSLSGYLPNKNGNGLIYELISCLVPSRRNRLWTFVFLPIPPHLSTGAQSIIWTRPFQVLVVTCRRAPCRRESARAATSWSTPDNPGRYSTTVVTRKPCISGRLLHCHLPTRPFFHVSHPRYWALPTYPTLPTYQCCLTTHLVHPIGIRNSSCASSQDQDRFRYGAFYEM